jgi:integral membrane sensor domain MASE1
MEYEELENLWKEYDSKLDNLEKMNKKLIRETLLKKPTRRLNWHKFNSLYGLIMVPIIIVVAMHPNFTKENVDLKFITGCVLTVLVVLYVSYINLKSYLIIKNVNLSENSVIESATKIVEFKKMYNTRWKHAFFYYPIIYLGVLLIAWNNFTFDNKTITFLIGLFIITYIANIFGPKSSRNRIARLEKEVLNLKEYVE